jgi:TadE-like protein
MKDLRKSLVIVKRKQRGQALVEFALTILFIFLLFVGMLEMIFLLYAYNTLADAAKEGVRYAIVHGTGNTQCSGPGLPSGSPPVICPDPSGTNVQTVVTNFAGLSMQSGSTVVVDYNPNNANLALCNVPGCMVRVKVSQTYQPFFGLGWPSVTLYAAADGRIMN